MLDIKIDENRIKELSKKYNLKLLVLHGSYAKGCATPKSDIDIGILGGREINGNDYSGILNDFGALFGDKFDPAFLDGADPMICYHAALRGKPLFEGKRGDFAAFKLQSIARYQDTKQFREMEKTYIKRIAAK